MKRGDFPLQKECDPKKPEEAFTWMFVAPPHISGAALPFSSEYLQLMSKRIWNCGARPHRNRQTIKYRPPGMGDPHWLTNPGRWVPIGEPDPPEQELDQVKLMAAMRAHDERGFFEAIEAVAGGEML